MATNLTGLRVFIASPQGLDSEHEGFRREVLEVNEDEAHWRGIAFIPVEWSLTHGGLGRPQARVNDELRRCDYLVLVLHDRWGSPPSPESSSRCTSGPEEEFAVAQECLVVVSVQKRVGETQATLARTYFERRYGELMNLSVVHTAGQSAETDLAGNG